MPDLSGSPTQKTLNRYLASEENILDLTLAGMVGGLNRLFYAQMRRTAAAATGNRFHFVENGRPGQTNFQKIMIQITNFRISFSHHHDVMTLRTSSYTAIHLTEVYSVATINTGYLTTMTS